MSDLVLGYAGGLFTASAISLMLVLHLGQQVRELIKDNEMLEAAQNRRESEWFVDLESLRRAVEESPVEASEGAEILNLSPADWLKTQ